MKKVVSILIIIVVLVTCGLTMVSCETPAVNTIDCIITLHSTALIELAVDKKGIVMLARPLNSEAEVMLIDFKLLTLPIKIAVSNIIKLAINIGYINNLQKTVYISSISDTDKTNLKYNRLMFDIIKGYNKQYEVEEYDYRLEKKDFRTFIRNNKGFENLTFTKYRIFNMLKREDETLNVKEILNKSNEQLSNLLLLLANNTAYGTYSLTKKVNMKVTEKKHIAITELNKLIGGEFETISNISTNLPILMTDILAKREQNSIDDAIISSIITQLEIETGKVDEEKLKMANKDGIINAQSLNEYFDQLYLSKRFLSIEERDKFEIKMNSLQNSFKTDYETLSSLEQDEINTLLGTSTDNEINKKVTTISEVDEIFKLSQVKTKNEYQKAYDQLNANAKIAADKINNVYNKAQEIVAEEMKNEIDLELRRLRDLKAELIANYAGYKKNK